MSKAPKSSRGRSPSRSRSKSPSRGRSKPKSSSRSKSPSRGRSQSKSSSRSNSRSRSKTKSKQNSQTRHNKKVAHAKKNHHEKKAKEKKERREKTDDRSEKERLDEEIAFHEREAGGFASEPPSELGPTDEDIRDEANAYYEERDSPPFADPYVALKHLSASQLQRLYDDSKKYIEILTDTVALDAFFQNDPTVQVLDDMIQTFAYYIPTSWAEWAESRKDPWNATTAEYYEAKTLSLARSVSEHESDVLGNIRREMLRRKRLPFYRRWAYM